MKKLFLIILIVSIACVVKAQQIPNYLNERSVVKDSTGKVLDYKTWTAIILAGNYNMRAKYSASDTNYIITAAKPMHINRVFDEHTIVKDLVGKSVPFNEWHDKILSSRYHLQPVGRDPNSGYILTPYTEQELTAFKSRIGKPAESPFFTTGKDINPFAVTDIYGKKIGKANWKNKIVVLNFWFVGCVPCRNEIPELNKLVAKYAGNPNVIFLGIALDHETEIKEFLKSNTFNYQLVADGKQYAGLFKINSYPTNVVIDKEGKVKFHTNGFGLNTVDWVDKAIAETVQQNSLKLKKAP
ncbi:TlpA family protein disulfide reductase [Inquilinus sp. KBS0705]|nr:TlpA family protein disulfide reductase [Inquilinus sp. KBS0705]